ncbi:penicillin acylase family protein [Tellurirhabdus rosea]|uniref:penicillin acylase family protein n=1 Tax=Tellurirhabdus rosea TaxID=2674997 RepID=UPI00224CCA0A|nr:penicillin acylase family protein [Tellurirhabdus rosea]
MRLVKALFSLLLAAGLIYALDRSWGSVPAFGRLISPFVGFWQNAESASPTDQTLDLAGTRAAVTVAYDDLGVPHVFAQNDHDVYFAQGYITARDRLWQMEFQTHAAAGRISEIVGERAAELDRFNRRLGMVYGAEQFMKGVEADPKTKEMLQAYSDGINAYINSLSPARYPLEYKLLGYAPEPWTPFKCALLLKQMTSTLALGNDDADMTNILARYGKAVTSDLFPNYPALESPIIPSGTPWNFTSLKVPQPPKDSLNSTPLAVNLPHHDPSIGSNNWAVGGAKSATGYPILANDPHLTLSLPSIWYQIQLHTPEMNVYGASLPGSPGVIIGFNRNVAWGVTNVGSDVLDLYRIKFRDAKKEQYWHDNQWKPVRRRVEVVRVKGRPDVMDTVLYTHHGPVMYLENEKPFRDNFPAGYAVRWIAHEVSNDVKCFYFLNRARNYDDYRKALTYYAAPAQNFVFASNGNDIAITPNGKFPLKWKEQGKFLLDGTNPAHDWQGWIPAEQNPHVKNPPRGFVSSANQFSTDPTYPYYLHWEYAPAERGRRINDRLTSMQKATVDSLRMLQNDNYNLRAADFLPVMLPAVQTQGLSSEQQKALQAVRTWNFQNSPDAAGASIFTVWLGVLRTAVWEDDLPTEGARPMRYPSWDRLLTLIKKEPASRWFDNCRTTDRRETYAELVNSSFRTAVDSLQKMHGSLGGKWAWAAHKSTDIRHLIPGLDALSAMDVQIGGGSSVVNATTERIGPSWRMVVALGPTPKGYGVYPGGQSGNPGSPYYLNLLETWRKGELNELLFLQSANEQSPRIKSKLSIK